MTTSQVPAGTIVVGVDDTGADDRALAWAALLARHEGQAITVLHATGSTPSPFGTSSDAEPGRGPDSLRADGRQVTSGARWTLRRDGFEGPVHEYSVASSPLAALTEASRTAGMLVVGAHGRGPLGMFVLGSVSRGLVGRAGCPVVVVPAPDESTSTAATGMEPVRGVLVAVDDHRPSHAALDFAYAQAALRGLPLTVLGCVLTPASMYTGAVELDPTDPEAELERRQLSEIIAGYAEQLPDVVVTLEVDQGRPEEAIVRAAGRHDLVVLGSHAHSWLSRLVTRDVDRWVVTHASCPVAVVPEPSTTGPAATPG